MWYVHGHLPGSECLSGTPLHVCVSDFYMLEGEKVLHAENFLPLISIHHFYAEISAN